MKTQMKTASQKTNEIREQLARNGIEIEFSQVHKLRRAELTLRRWSELECGDSNDFASWCISRDEQTGKPYMEIHNHQGLQQVRRRPIADKERGALKRIKSICDAAGLTFYHQGDPRGCALYIGKSEMLRGGEIESCYTRLVPCCS